MSKIIKSLADKIDEEITPVTGRNSLEKVVLADIPVHPNVGDDAITLGELTFLRKHHKNIKVSAFPYNLLSTQIYGLLEQADTIFLHGGGNFGDIWPHHHNVRLEILDSFPNKNIVQFPQSIHFSDKVALEKTRRSVAKARNFTLFVRDKRSYSFAKAEFNCDVRLCPDIVFSLGEKEPKAPQVQFECLLRTDKEIREEKSDAVQRVLRNKQHSFEVNDWLENSFWEKRYLNVWNILRHSISSRLLVKHGMPLLESYATSRVNYGLRTLSRGEAVVTDRLHGYILSTLLGRKRYVFDSYDGKIRAFHDTWLSEDPSAIFCNSVEEFNSKI